MTEFAAKHKRKLDIAYGCHAYLAVFVGSTCAEELFDFWSYEDEVFLTLWLGVPTTILALAAALTVLALTIWLWRHWPLLVLLAVPNLLLLVSFRDHPLLVNRLYFGWFTLVLFFAGWWFFHTRRSLRH